MRRWNEELLWKIEERAGTPEVGEADWPWIGRA